MYNYKATLHRVIDGDTMDFVVDLGFKIQAKIRVRVKDYDAPEVRGPEKVQGKLVKAYCEQVFADCENIMLKTYKTGKYGRWLADVMVNLKGTGSYINIVELLMEEFGDEKTN